MLVLSRHIDESIQIGEYITITILGIKGKQVRIGITAPADVDVHREELYVRIMRDRYIAGGDESESDEQLYLSKRK